MDETHFEILSSSEDLAEVAGVLQIFIAGNENAFAFPNLSQNNRRVLLWTALFQHLQNKQSAEVHPFCLAAVRVLSRDKTDLQTLLCEKWITTLVEKAGLYNYVDYEDELMTPVDMPEKRVAVEALKCLCNLTYNSELARTFCANTAIAQGLVARLRLYKDIPFKDDIMLFDMKLMFILTALREDIKSKIRDELHGMDYLISCLNEILLEASMTGGAASGANGVWFLNDNQEAIACEILKAQFNLISHSETQGPANEREDSMYLRLMPVLTGLLCVQVSSEEKLLELRSNIANLLTSVPPAYFEFLTPVLNEGEPAMHTYEGRNMDALQALLHLLQHRLTITANPVQLVERLTPVLTAVVTSARVARSQRRYMRMRVLPALRDVSRPPEHGTSMRNVLCRLLTTPVTPVRDLVAEFLFVLCKEKVSRMVKYTGFGNAAGHLAQKGLLGGGRGGEYSSSEDSDTEEYLQAQPHIDPVVGCTLPPRANPFDGMTNEQKEYEAMKLVNLFDKLVTEGVVKPARVGPDGRPQPIDHVMELQDHPPNRSQN